MKLDSQVCAELSAIQQEIKMGIEVNQSHLAKNKISIPRIIILVVGIVAVLICSVLGLQILGGIALGIAMSSGGDTVLHSDPNPDNTIIVHVVSDDCGVTCDCSTRLDIQYGKEIKKGVYRIRDACDVTIVWLDQYRFEVISRFPESMALDARDFENLP